MQPAQTEPVVSRERNWDPIAICKYLLCFSSKYWNPWTRLILLKWDVRDQEFVLNVCPLMSCSPHSVRAINFHNFSLQCCSVYAVFHLTVVFCWRDRLLFEHQHFLSQYLSTFPLHVYLIVMARLLALCLVHSRHVLNVLLVGCHACDGLQKLIFFVCSWLSRDNVHELVYTITRLLHDSGHCFLPQWPYVCHFLCKTLTDFMSLDWHYILNYAFYLLCPYDIKVTSCLFTLCSS